MSDDNAVSTESEEREPGSTHTSAQELGDITAQRLQGGLRIPEQTVGTEGDAVDYYRFTLSEAREVRLGLKLRQGEAELYLEDAEGNVLARSMAYAGFEVAVRTLLPGTYYVRVEAVGAAASEYDFRCGVLEANASFRPASNSAWYAGFAAELGMPSFEEAGYGFELSETVDGSMSGVLLGTVLAVDPNGEELSYRIVGGNGSELFALGGASGELSYVGAGEDFEGGAGPYELTIRASDGTHTIDTTVTVTITDAAEAPVFGEGSYAFELTENADGRANGLSLGRVTATDPDGDEVRYSLTGGNESMLFNIDAASGELYYVGPGEDYESGVTSYELTVRASDAAHTVDTTVTVTVTDAGEAPAFGEESYAFEVAENVDGSVNRLSLGTVTATDPDSDTVRYSLLDGNDSSLFAIGETSGELYYVGAGEDFEGGVTSYELTVRASDGTHTIDTTVTVTVTDAAEAPAFGDGSYAFELAENADGRANGLSLGRVLATDPDGDEVRYSLTGGNELFTVDETSGELYYVGPGEDYESGVTSYEVTVRASDAAHTADTTVTVTVTDEADAPAFGEESYAFELAENVDGRINRLSLGAVTVTDPGSDAVRYSLVSGNDSSLFAIEETSGELFYVGAGEDFEGGVTSYELTIRASDGTHTIDTTVTVTVTDAAEAPAFGDGSYAFELAENADGRANGLSLGRVLATDPDRDEVRYSLTGGNESMLFNIDETSGELHYVGAGEDYESGVTSYELTVRASDAAHTVDTTVTVTVTDEADAPAFAEESYAFELAENADGRVNWISLGAVTATDPDSDTVRYSLVGGNDSDLFAIGETSGELYYVGPGEDFEGGVTSYELTVRASDGTHASDTAVTVALGDVRGHSEPEGGDLPNDRTTTGMVLVDEAPVTGNIESTWDLDWFAVELVAGRTYQIDFRGQPTGDGTLVDPFLYGVFDGDGRLIRGTTSPDGGTSYNSRLVFTAPGEGTYYIATSGNGTYPSGTGTYELEVRDVRAPVFAEADYRFALSENAEGSVNRQSLGTVTATDPDGGTVRYRLVGGNESQRFAIDPDTGEVFYVGSGEDYESRVTSHELTVRASDGAYSTEVTVTVTVTDVAEAPEFAAESYAFELAENVDGSDERLSLGVVEAVDPEGDPVHYSLAGGNASDLFAIEETSGELYYIGSGENFESGVTSYELTVGASDGAYSTEVTVTVTVTDAAEAPVFGEETYFELAENTDGSVNRISLGVVDAVDPDGDEVRYSLASGNETDRFAIDPATGELYYVGPGEDFEGDAGAYELTVRASDGENWTDTSVTVAVTGRQSGSEPAGQDLPAARQTTGTVGVDEEPVAGTLGSQSDRDWFAVTLAPGRTYLFSIFGDTSDGDTGTSPTIRGLRDSNGAPVPGIGDGVDVEFTTDAGAADAVYYVVVAGEGSSGQGTDVPRSAGTSGFGTRSAGIRSVGIRSVETGNSDKGGTEYQLWVNDISSRSSVADDFSPDATNSGTVVAGGSVTGEIERYGDRDWFEVYLEAGNTYRFDLTGLQRGGGTLRDPFLRGIHDANGRLIPATTNNDSSSDWFSRVFFIQSDDGTSYGSTGAVLANNGLGGGSSRVFFTPAEDGTFYVSAGAFGPVLGTYTLSVSLFGDDYASSIRTTGEVEVGGSTTGRIDFNGDHDWFRVSLVAGKVYRIDVRGADVDDESLRDPYLGGIYDADGKLFPGTTDPDPSSVSNNQIYFLAPQDGTYYVAAKQFQWIGTGAPYTVSVTEITDDYAADTGTTGAVEVGGSTTGSIDFRGDHDWFAVQLVAGKVYRVDVRGTDADDESLRDPHLGGIHDAGGKLIPGTTDPDPRYPANNQIYFLALQDGIYYVAAKPVWNRFGIGDTYTVSVTEIADDYAADTGTTGAVEVGSPTAGSMDFLGDRDWFAVQLEAGSTYLIDLEGSWQRHGVLRFPVIHGLFDSRGHRIPDTYAAWSDDRPNSRLHFTAGVDGTYYVSAGTRDHYGRPGTYTLSVSVTEIADDYAAYTATTGRVEVGGSTTGSIDFLGDRDWFAVDLEAGWRYRFELKGADTGDGTLPDPVIPGIYRADGRRIDGTFDQDGGTGRNSRMTYYSGSDGTYYVAAEAAHAEAAVGMYTLYATRVDDDHPSSIGTTGTVEVEGSITGRIDYGGDRDWFQVTLEAGKFYRIDLKGFKTNDGTSIHPNIYGVHDARGNRYSNADDRYHHDRLYNSWVYFNAPADGDYYVSAGENSDRRTGTYTLSVTEVVGEYAANTATTGTVAVGGSVASESHYWSDFDWFAVTMEAGKVYRIVVKGNSLSAVYDSSGTRIRDVPFRSDRTQFEFTPGADDTFYMAIGTYAIPGRFIRVGPYTLSVMETEPSVDYASSTATTGTVAVGSMAGGVIGFDGDRDWFAVSLEAGKAYQIDLKGSSTGDGTLPGAALHGLHDSEGILIPGTADNDGGPNSNSRVFFAPDETSVYYVSAGPHGSQQGSYTLTVTEIEDDYASYPGTTGTIAGGNTVAGEIDYEGDRDWFEVALELGKVYLIDLKGADTGDGTLSDPYLRGIYDSEGNPIADTADDNSGSGSNSQVFFTAGATDTYYVSAGANGSHTGTYRLRLVETESAVDYTEDTSTTGTLPVGRTVAGAIAIDGDRDWFAVALMAGNIYLIDLKGADTGDGTLSDPYLRGIYDSQGNLLPGTTDDNGGDGSNSRVFFAPNATDTYYVSAGTVTGQTGSYTISVTKTDFRDDHISDIGTTGEIVVGGTVAAGMIDYSGDRDWFAVALVADNVYRFDLKGKPTDDGTLRNPYLRGIYDSEGNPIADTADDNGGDGSNSQVFFAPNVTDTYYVSAGGSGDDQGTYRLSVSEIDDDFVSHTGTAGRVAVGGTTTGTIDYRGDRDWFAVPLEQGKAYRFDLKGFETGDGTLRDPYLRGIYDSEGNPIADTADDNGGSGSNSLVDFIADETDTYYVSVGGSGGDQGTYTLSAIEIVDDYASDTTTTGTVEVSGSATGSVDVAGDRDWFAVTLEADKSYRFDLEGKGLLWNGGTLDYARIHGIYDSESNRIVDAAVIGAFTGSYSQAVFTPEEDDTYYVSAGGHTGGRGTYTLSVTAIADDYASNTGTTGTVTVGDSTTGMIEHDGDRDWFAVTLDEDTTYRFRVRGHLEEPETNTLWVPQLLGIYDATGEVVDGTTINDGSSRYRMEFSADEPGTYYVSVGTWLSDYGTYTLSVEEVTDGM